MMPFARMDCANSSSRSEVKIFRAWSGFGSIRSIATSRAVSSRWGCTGGGSGTAARGRVGTSAPSPLPSAFRVSGLFMVENFLRKFDIAFGAFGTGVVRQDRLAEARGLCQSDAPGNDGLKDLFLEELPEIAGNLASQVRAVVEHREENASDSKGVAESVVDTINGVHELGNAFQREEFALDRHEDGIGCHQGVEGEKVEGRRAVDQDVLEVVSEGGDAFAEACFAVFDLYEVQIGADEVFVGRNDGKPFGIRGADR